MKDQFDEILYEDLTEDLKLLADYCGIELVRKAMRELSGMNFYIPKISRLDNFMIRYLRENRSKSRKEIAKFLNVSEQYLKKYS